MRAVCPAYLAFSTEGLRDRESYRGDLCRIRARVLPIFMVSIAITGVSFGNQETSRWDPAGHADNQPWITFLTRELFIQNLFISYNK